MGDYMSTVPFVACAALILLLAATPRSCGDVKAEDFIFPDREAFLRQLKLESPKLAAVKAALDKGDVEAAGKAYIAYFRARDISSTMLTDWSAVARDPRYNTSRADSLLAGHLWDGYSVYEVPESGIDWQNAPLTCLTRFPIFSPLWYAFHHTQDPKYLRFLVDHMLGYMNAYPIEEFVGKGTEGWRGEFQAALPWHWCMIDMRLMQMANTVALIRSHPEVIDEELLRILQRMHEETLWLQRYIQKMVDGRHNGGCSWMETVLYVSPILADFKAADEWMAYDAQLLNQYIDEAFYPDGMCIELTTAYSTMVASMTQRMAYAMRDQAAFQTAKPKLAAMMCSWVALGAPTGRVPSFGDNYASHFASGIYKPLLDVLDLPWVRTMVEGGEGPLPPFTVWPAPGEQQWCGYYSMRSDWTPNARFMMIDGGPWGTSHQHGDRLSLAVTAYGADFIIDPTATKYHDNTPEAFLSRQQAGFLHNTITVDGVDEFVNSPYETKEPLDNTWEHGDNWTLFAGSYSFAPVKTVNWERRVLFAGKSYWLLQDIITGEQDTAQVEQNFQFEKDTEIEFQGDVTIAKAPNGARLVLKPLGGSLQPQLTIGDETPHTTYWRDGKPKTDWGFGPPMRSHGRGWTGRWTGRLMPAPAVTYVGAVNLPAMITVAIIPLAPAEELAEVPEIGSHEAEGQVVWTLPTASGQLRFATSVEQCRVIR